jgi:hypothetical protein
VAAHPRHGAVALLSKSAGGRAECWAKLVIDAGAYPFREALAGGRIGSSGFPGWLAKNPAEVGLSEPVARSTSCKPRAGAV